MCNIGIGTCNNAGKKKSLYGVTLLGRRKLLAILCLTLFVLQLAPVAADASPTGRGLPWETTLKALSDSFKGPVAYAICILMIVAGCFGIMFGGDLAGWIRWACMAAVVVGMIGLSSEVLDMMGMSTRLVM